MRGFPAVAALLELLLAQVVEVRVDVLVQDLIADAGVGGKGDCGEVDVDARRRRAVLMESWCLSFSRSLVTEVGSSVASSVRYLAQVGQPMWWH